jgi:hypothetical protein
LTRFSTSLPALTAGGRVIGQDEAVQAVADALIRARSGLKDSKRPIGSFIRKGAVRSAARELKGRKEKIMRQNRLDVFIHPSGEVEG